MSIVERQQQGIALARLEERIEAMQRVLVRIEEGIQWQFKQQSGQMEALSNRLGELENWRSKIIGGLVVMGALATVGGAVLTKLLTGG